MKRMIRPRISLVLVLAIASNPLTAISASHEAVPSRLPAKRGEIARPAGADSARKTKAQTAPVAGQTSTLLPDGRRLKIGGFGTDGSMSPALLIDARTGDATPAGTLTHPRAWHTATLLPDATVLVVGGLDASGKCVDTAEIYSPVTARFEPLPDSGLTPRARHSATVLTDGKVLIAGGLSASARDDKTPLGTAELWDFRTRTVTQLAATLETARYDHSAALLADGRVLLSGGIAGDGAPLVTAEFYDPESQSFNAARSLPPADEGPPKLAGSLPIDGATSVPVDALIALRFSRPLRVESVSSRTVTLNSSEGPAAINMVPVEGGMLAFLNPMAPLSAGSAYTASIAGAYDDAGQVVEAASIRFSTAVEGIPEGAVWTPDDRNYHGDWTSGFAPSPWKNNPPLQAAPGVTALAGQVLRIDGWPLAGVKMAIGDVRTTTDDIGRFLLPGVAKGRATLIVDCRPASTAATTYGFFMVAVDVLVEGVTNVLPYTTFVPVLDTKNAIPLRSPTKREVVATTPLIPDLEVHIPAGTVLRNVDGDPIRSMTITPVPIDRGPFPLPLGVRFPVYFTLQLGGTRAESINGTASPDIHIVFPNYAGARPDSRIDFWSYDAAGVGWFTYGHGTVSKNGKQIVPDPGVVIHLFTCASIGAPVSVVGPNGSACDGEPVDLSTGLFVYRQTDFVLPDTIPISLTRTYRPNYTLSGPFGIGAFHTYELFLVGDRTNYSYADLMMPDGSRVHYTRTSSGTNFDGAIMVHNTTPSIYYQSTLTGFGSGLAGPYWELKLKDGTLYHFSVDAREDAPLTMIQDRNGNRLDIQRNTVGLMFGLPSHYITSITTPNGRFVQFTYDGSYRVTQARDNIGRTVNYAYDSGGRLTQVTDANGGITIYTYDAANRMLTIKDPRQIVYLTNQYDTNGRVTLQTQVDNTTFQFAYTLDGNGNVTQTNITDPRGDVRQVTFNSDGYSLSDTYAMGKPEQQAYTLVRQSGSNFITSATDALSRTTAYSYDTMGNLTGATLLSGSPNSVTTTFAYEPAYNQLTSVTDPLNHVTAFGRDAKSNMTSITDALNNQTTVAYNTLGQPASVTDPLNRTWQYGYLSGDLAAVTNPLGQVLTRFTDGAGRVVSITNATGQTVSLAWDAENRPTSVTDPLGGVTALAYDGNNDLLSVTDARNNAIAYTYDNMDRVATRKDGLLHADTYVYDANGNLHQITDRKSQVRSYAYDGLDRLTQITYGDNSTTTYTYDAGNRITQMSDSISGNLTYSYDGLDRVTSVTTPQGTVSYTYDAASRRSTMSVPGQSTINYTYDNADRLTQITQGGSTVTFAYDNASRRTSLTFPNGVIAQYSYDNASRLTGITYSKGGATLGNLAYAYDAAGRRTSVTGSLGRTGLPQTLSTASYNGANQQTGFGGQTLTYDLNGNLTSDGTNTYTWNARDQLLSMSGPGLTASFQYDATGKRGSKTINGGTTSFVYDGANIVQEQVGGSATANSLTGGVDQFFTRTDASGAVSPLADALGSTVALVDSSGNVQTQYTYEPFGKASASGTANANSQKYTNREDDGTGLYYYRNRYYSPSLQRFISEDPIGPLGGTHSYPYAWNNPISFVDPSGLDAGDFAGGVIDGFLSIQRALGNLAAPGSPVSGILLGGVNYNSCAYRAGVYTGIATAIAASALLPMIAAESGGAWLAEAEEPAVTARGGAGPVLRGQAGVARAVGDIEAEGGTVLGRDPTVDAGGVRVRPDLYVENSDGSREFVEVKNGPYARVTQNQRTGYEAIEQGGAIPRGRRAEAAGLPPGQPIPPTRVRVIHYP
jgi:RHS repeat-associated protein